MLNINALNLSHGYDMFVVFTNKWCWYCLH